MGSPMKSGELSVASISIGSEPLRRDSTVVLLESGDTKITPKEIEITEKKPAAEETGNIFGNFTWHVARITLVLMFCCLPILIPLDPPDSSSVAANYKFLIFAFLIVSPFTLSHRYAVFKVWGYPPTPALLENWPDLAHVLLFWPDVMLGFLAVFTGAFIPMFAHHFPVPLVFIGTSLVYNGIGNYMVPLQYPKEIRQSAEFKGTCSRIAKVFNVTIISIFFVDIVSVVYLIVGGIAQVFTLLSISIVGFVSRYLIIYVATKHDMPLVMGPLLLSNFITIQFPTIMIMPRATSSYVLTVSFIFHALSSAWPVLIALFQASKLNQVHTQGVKSVIAKLNVTPEIEAKVTFLNFLCNFFSIVIFVPIVVFYSYGYNVEYSYFGSDGAHKLLGEALGLIIGNSMIAIILFFVSRKMFLRYFGIDTIVMGNEELKNQGWFYVMSVIGIIFMTILYMIRHFNIYYYVAKDLYASK